VAPKFRCSMWAKVGGIVATLLAGVALTEMLRWLERFGIPERRNMRRSLDLLPKSADHATLTKTMSGLKTLLSDIEVGPSVGAGTFGIVYKGNETDVCSMKFVNLR
jgi:hypothetical protein